MLKGMIRDAVKSALNDDEGDRKTVKDMTRQIEGLEKDLRELKYKKEMEEKEVKHLVKMKEEKITIETEKKEIELQKQFQKKEMDLQTQYHDKIMKAIETGQKKMEDIYTKILDRLPNVNMEIERKVR